MTGAEATIRRLDAAEIEGQVGPLGALLHACVHAGASVGFVLPFETMAAEAFWRDRVLPAVRAGQRDIWVAVADGMLAGTVQLNRDTMPNQPHRADVSKLLVHPAARRRGIARALMAALEAHARAVGRTLLTLDTRTGDAAEPLYRSLGYATVGTIPGYCLDPFGPALDATTIMYKAL